jgi:hypothetical protein
MSVPEAGIRKGGTGDIHNQDSLPDAVLTDSAVTVEVSKG